MTGRGIPFYYYGSEQAYAGGNDPQNREVMGNNMNTDSDIYKFTAAINKARKAHSIWNQPMTERYVLDNVYSFSRGDFMVALTNSNNQVNIQPSTPWSDGTKICNIFYPDSDCQTVANGGKMNLTLMNGEAKIYVPSDSKFFDEDFDGFEPVEWSQEPLVDTGMA